MFGNENTDIEVKSNKDSQTTPIDRDNNAEKRSQRAVNEIVGWKIGKIKVERIEQNGKRNGSKHGTGREKTEIFLIDRRKIEKRREKKIGNNKEKYPFENGNSIFEKRRRSQNIYINAAKNVRGC